MKQFDVIIIDDETSAIGTLRIILERHFDHYVVVGEAQNVSDGIKLIQSTKFDILFLDIKMHDGTGFDLLEKIEDAEFEVIFTTAYSDFAIKAFENSAIGYILKPLSISQLEQTLKKAEQIITDKKKAAGEDHGITLESPKMMDKLDKKLIIPTVSGFEVVRIDDIIRCEGDRNYTHFMLKDGSKFLTSKTLKQYDEFLSELGFFRIHKSHLINLNHVKRYIKGSGGSVEMSDGAMITISRQKKKEFHNYFLTK